MFCFTVSGDAGKTVTVYFAAGKWYDWYTYSVSSNGGENVVVNTPTDYIPVRAIISF